MTDSTYDPAFREAEARLTRFYCAICKTGAKGWHVRIGRRSEEVLPRNWSWHTEPSRKHRSAICGRCCKIVARIVRAALDCRRLEKERLGKLEACERFDPDEPDHAAGYPGGQATLACPDVTREEEADSKIILSTFEWCAGCRARHHTTVALYAARRRLRMATDAYKKTLGAGGGS